MVGVDRAPSEEQAQQQAQQVEAARQQASEALARGLAEWQALWPDGWRARLQGFMAALTSLKRRGWAGLRLARVKLRALLRCSHATQTALMTAVPSLPCNLHDRPAT